MNKYFLTLKGCHRIEIMAYPTDMQTLFYNLNKRNIIKLEYINANGIMEDITSYIM